MDDSSQDMFEANGTENECGSSVNGNLRFACLRAPVIRVFSLTVAASVCLLLVVVLGGCAGYRLGSALPPNVKSLHIPTFINKCGEPQVESETTKAAIQEFHKDGTLRVTSAAGADAALEVTLVDFKLEPLRYEKDMEKTVQEYRMKITAEITFRRGRTRELLMEKRVEGESTFVLEGGLSESKRKALPVAARDLAHDIVESVVEFW